MIPFVKNVCFGFVGENTSDQQQRKTLSGRHPAHPKIDPDRPIKMLRHHPILKQIVNFRSAEFTRGNLKTVFV